MRSSELLRKTALAFSLVMFGGAVLAPDSWLGGGILLAEDDEYYEDGEMEYEDEDEDDARPFQQFLQNFGKALQEQQNQQNNGFGNPNNNNFGNNNFGNNNFGNNNFGGQNNQPNWLGEVIKGLENLESNEDKFDREEERLDRLWERGKISDEQYDNMLEKAADRLGVQDYDYQNYDSGWEQRQQYWQHSHNSENWNLDQKKLGLEYVKYGDRPLEADKGLVPKPNPVLESAQVYDGVAADRLAKVVGGSVKDEASALRKSLPEGCRIEDAVSLVARLKEEGGQVSLIESLQAALVDRDIRRFERNAQALLVKQEEIQRLLIGLTMENLQDKLEDGASSEEVSKITEPMVRRVDQAGLDEEFSKGFAAWLQNVPEMLSVQSKLNQGVTASAGSWPDGELKLLFDPLLTNGEARMISKDLLAVGGEGETQLCLGVGNKYTANGLSVLKGNPVEQETDANGKPKQIFPTLLLHYPGDVGDPLKYTIVCFRDVPAQTPGSYQPQEAWRQEYSIKPGLKQPLELSYNGRLWYRIECPTKDGSGTPKAYTLKPVAGYSPTYAFRVSGNDVTLVSTLGGVTVDNTHNSRTFEMMVGNEYHPIRPGAKETFDGGVTLRYARNGKTAAPKDVQGNAIPNAKEESTDISTITLREGESGVIGVNSKGEWEIRKGDPEFQVAERKRVELPVVVAETVKANSTAEGNAVATTTVTPRGTLYVLAVGVAKYKNPADFPQLAYADKDVTVLADVLEQQKKALFHDVKPIILTNEQATAIKIRTELVGLERKVTKNDTVAILISGHGFVEKNSYYFCPHDTERAKLTRQGISCNELQRVTNGLSAKNVFVLLDSCYSGGATDTFKNQVQRVGDSGVVIFASSKGTESSQEDKSWGHGALTKAFLDTISNPDLDLNNDSIVQVAELDSGLTEGVKSLTNGGQHVQSAELGDAIKHLSLVRFSVSQ